VLAWMEVLFMTDKLVSSPDDQVIALVMLAFPQRQGYEWTKVKEDPRKLRAWNSQDKGPKSEG